MEHEGVGRQCEGSRRSHVCESDLCSYADSDVLMTLPTDSSVSSNDAADCSSVHHVFVDHTRASQLLHSISHLYLDALFTDVTLCAGMDEMRCHRNILAASSTFFLGMFQSALDESRQSKIPIKEMEASTLRLVLDYVYTGKVSLTVDNVQSVLSAANMFEMLTLRDGCASFMVHHVTVDNCVGVYFFARAHECHELASCAQRVITGEFETVCRLPELLSLPADKLIDIISDDQVSVITSCRNSYLVVCWLKYNDII